MPSTFLPLQIGLSGLQAAQLGVETAGNNISNANTAGYARETVDLQTTTSLQVYTDNVNYIGQGVDPRQQNRIVDASVNQQYRTNNASQAYWQTQSTELSNVAQIFAEPSGSTLRQSLDGFYAAWNGVAQSPSSTAARAQALQAGKALTDAFNITANTLTQSQTRYANQVEVQVQQVNSLANSIASLNTQIEQAQATGNAPNSLLDQRSALLDQLSSLVSINVVYTPDASNSNIVHMAINLGQASGAAIPPLLTDGTVNALTDPASTSSYAQVSKLSPTSGSLRSTYDMYTYSQGISNQMDTLANSIVADTNAQQSAGVDVTGAAGQPFFAGSGAAGISVNLTNGSQLAAAAAGQPANSTDGSNAQAISDLLQTKGYDATYSATITQMGTDGQAANQQMQTAQSLTTQASQVRTSVSGVDINQEMGNLVKYQQSYTAASKFVSVFNDMLTTLMQNV